MSQIILLYALMLTPSFAQPEKDYPYYEIDLMQLRKLWEFNRQNNETKPLTPPKENIAPDR